jgi:hypothetical protein
MRVAAAPQRGQEDLLTCVLRIKMRRVARLYLYSIYQLIVSTPGGGTGPVTLSLLANANRRCVSENFLLHSYDENSLAE